MTPIAALSAFALITIAMIGFEIMYTYATQGFGFGFSSNRPAVTLSAFGVRMKRALQNQTESAAYIVPVLASAQFLGLSSDAISLAILIIVLGRAAFVVLYYTGIPFIRIPGFVCGTLPSVYLAVLILMATYGA
ncbi:MAG: MAPEG family protein [Pelagimonas sp.]|uniref:MAPEG family protein n=1 Tax=Pelagimonas sp. TaxID=2073170 RepID=UPI003D6B56AD